MKKFNKEEYLKLSKEERAIYKEKLNQFKDELTKIEYAEYEERQKQREKETYYSVNILDNFDFINNIRNWISLYGKSPKGFIVILSTKELSEIEEYGLEEIMINTTKKYTTFDLLIATFKGTYNKSTDHINSFESISTDNGEINLYVSNLSKKYVLPDELKDGMYAYCMYYEILNYRNKKSFIWRLFHRRKQIIKRQYNV